MSRAFEPVDDIDYIEGTPDSVDRFTIVVWVKASDWNQDAAGIWHVLRYPPGPGPGESAAQVFAAGDAQQTGHGPAEAIIQRESDDRGTAPGSTNQYPAPNGHQADETGRA